MHPSDLIPSSARPGAPTSEELLRAGEISLAAGRTAEALRLFAVAVRADGRSTEALTAFGRALALSGDHARALTVLRRSLAADPVQRGAWMALAEVELARDEPEAALESLDRALALGSPCPDLLVLLGTARLRAGDAEGARRAAEHGLGRAPDDARLHALSASIDRAEGQDERAAQRLSHAATLDPDGQSRAWYDVARGGHAVDRDAIAAELARADAEGDRERQADLHFALANDLAAGDDPAALAHAAAGQALTADGYDAAAHSALVDQVVATFDTTYFAQVRGAGLRGSAPVFVVGARGAAREHVARMLAAHPKLERRVEAYFAELADEVGPAIGLSFPAGCERLQPGHWAGIAHRFVDTCGTAARGVRTLDDAPDNLPHLGTVASCLPDARVIHVRSDRRDALVEGQLEHGDEQPSPHPTTLTERAARSLDDERLMEHWRRALPLPILEVDARDIAGEPEVQRRRLFEFVGAPLDAAPPSEDAELRVGRWRRYEDELRAELPSDWF